MDSKRCLHCGKEIKDIPGRRPKVYCGLNCRQKAWQHKHKNELIVAPVAPPEQQPAIEQSQVELGHIPTAKSFRAYMDLIKAGSFDTQVIRKEVQDHKKLNSNQKAMIFSKLK